MHDTAVSVEHSRRLKRAIDSGSRQNRWADPRPIVTLVELVGVPPPKGDYTHNLDGVVVEGQANMDSFLATNCYQ